MPNHHAQSSAILNTVSCLGVYSVLLLTVSSQGTYVALHTASLQMVDTQCVTAYYIICLGVCRVITACSVITGGGLYGTA